MTTEIPNFILHLTMVGLKMPRCWSDLGLMLILGMMQRTSLQPCFVFYFHDWERSFFKSKQWRILRSKNAIYSLLFMKTIYQKDWLALDLSVIKVTINVTKNENLFNTILKIFNYDLFFDMKIVKNEMK